MLRARGVQALRSPSIRQMPRRSPRHAAKHDVEAADPTDASSPAKPVVASPKKTPTASPNKARTPNSSKSSYSLSPSLSKSPKSPRLAARHEAARTAAQAVAAAIRQRVWAEAKAPNGERYFYSLTDHTTSWELPSWAILRAAGRDSICPPRPSVGRGASFRKSGTSRTSLASSLQAAAAAAGLSSESIREEEEAVEEEHQLDGKGTAETGGEDGPGEEMSSPVELGEVLHVVLGYLGETKALHEAAKAEIQKLKREQAADMAKAQEAIAVLAARASENAALTSGIADTQPSFPEQADKAGAKRRSLVSARQSVDLSAWAAECERLRDGLAVAERSMSKLSAELAASKAENEILVVENAKLAEQFLTKDNELELITAEVRELEFRLRA